MRKVLSVVAMITVLALAVGLGVTAFAQGSNETRIDPASVSSVTQTDPASVSTDDPTPAGGEVKGNCDEAEHANDPGCSGAIVDGPSDDSSTDGSEDHSGPSDDSSIDGSEDHSGPSDDSSIDGSEDD